MPSIERFRTEMAKPAVPVEKPEKRERRLVPARPGIPQPAKESPVILPVPAIPQRTPEKVPA